MALKDPTAKEFKKSSLNINEGEHEHGKHPNSLKRMTHYGYPIQSRSTDPAPGAA